MLRPPIYLLVLLAVFDTMLVFPQKQYPALSHLTDENGLSSNFATDVLHDDLGYVRIATREGRFPQLASWIFIFMQMLG